MTDITPHKPNQQWDGETKAKLINHYAVSGSAMECHRAYPHVPYESIRYILQGEEAVAQLTTLRDEKSTEHRQAYSRLVDKSLRAAEKGIDKLDGQKLTANDIKALVITGAASTDKITLADNQPTRITATDSSTASVLKFLEQIGQSYHEKQVNVVQVIDKTEEPS